MKDGFLKFEKITEKKVVSAFESINHLWRKAFLIAPGGPSLQRPKAAAKDDINGDVRGSGERSSRPICWDSPPSAPAATASSSLVL